jgi:hypothetical protein
MVFTTFWANFSRTHLVTLLTQAGRADHKRIILGKQKPLQTISNQSVADRLLSFSCPRGKKSDARMAQN